MSARHRRRVAAALLTAAIVAACSGLGGQVASAAEPPSPADAALGWLAGELAANDGMLTITFGSDAFPDPGLTIDAILAEVAGGHGADPAVQGAIAAVDTATFDYVNQFSSFPADRAANATAKALLLEQTVGTDLGDTVALEPDLRDLMATDGDDVGRFNDTDLQGYGNYANGLGQALAVLALDRTAGGAPSDAVDFLLSQQCSDGSFRLYYFGYAISFDPFETVQTHTCADPAEGDVDATALALDALLAVPTSAPVTAAIGDAVGFLLGAQTSAGGFTGTGAVNANSTGLAGAALRTAGEAADADQAAGFLADLQLLTCTDLGALAYDQAGFDAGIDADRDQWIRATAQGVMGLGLPSYGTIGSASPTSAGLSAVACPAVPPVRPTPTASLTASSVVAGGSVTVTGAGFTPGEIVDITLHSTPINLGAAVADVTGIVTKAVTIPADLEPGDHQIELVGRTSGRTATIGIEVLAATAARGTARLPVTGRHTSAETGIALALLAVGGALVAAGRRRQLAVG